MNFWNLVYLIVIGIFTVFGYIRFCNVMDKRAKDRTKARRTKQHPQYRFRNKLIFAGILVIWFVIVMGQFLSGGFFTILAIVVSILATVVLCVMTHSADQLKATALTFLNLSMASWALCSILSINVGIGWIILGILAGILVAAAPYVCYWIGKTIREADAPKAKANEEAQETDEQDEDASESEDTDSDNEDEDSDEKYAAYLIDRLSQTEEGRKELARILCSGRMK